jgi:hypothetical protein
MRRFLNHILIGLAICGGALTAPDCWASTYDFSFTANPGNFIADHLTSYDATPSTGWNFSATTTGDHYVELYVGNSQPGPPIYWELDLAAPSGQTLVPGSYTGTARYPFESANQPGMTLTGNFWGDDTDTGFFTITQADYGPGNTVNAFAVDFTQYDEGQTSSFITGQFLFNTTVPEPSGFFLIAAALMPLACRMRNRRRD